MKVKVKYSPTQKFVLNIEEQTLGVLKDEIKKFVENTYNQPVKEPLTVSLNGSDPLTGPEDATLQSLGIVPGDMLIVLPPSSVTDRAKSSPQKTVASSQASASSQAEVKASTSTSPNKDVKEKKTDFNTQDTHSDPKVSKKRDPSESPVEQPPANLEILFNEYTPATASQALNLLVHHTILESGFHLKNSSGPPVGWKEMVATFHYSHNSFPNFKCTLVLVTMGEVKQVLASFPQQESEISVRLMIGEYFKDTSSSPVTADSLVHVAQLTRTLRDRLLHPLQIAVHQALGVPAPWHLVGLPQELLLMIAGMLDYHSVLNLRETCRRFHSVMDDNKLWQNLFKRDFSNLYGGSGNSNIVDWKAKYREAVNRRKDWKRVQDGLEYVIPGVFPTSPFMPPGYPGGPYPHFPQPRGPDPYAPQPHPQPNPFFDPDSPYFSGEIPIVPGTLPEIPDPLGPLGPIGPLRPRPGNPFQPPFMPTRPRAPRGPRFDFF
ncbi:F-box only protein 7-like isoform X1 [Homarus americanus]|nr:F-box only protein 7-like isoform X1 [Homarus americanus]